MTSTAFFVRLHGVHRQRRIRAHAQLKNDIREFLGGERDQGRIGIGLGHLGVTLRGKRPATVAVNVLDTSRSEVALILSFGVAANILTVSIVTSSRAGAQGPCH